LRSCRVSGQPARVRLQLLIDLLAETRRSQKSTERAATPAIIGLPGVTAMRK
jgi:hypothetical protein